MNLSELVIFTENLAKMLNDGVMFKKAFQTSSGSLTEKETCRFADDLKDVILGFSDLDKLKSYRVPAFYIAMVKCGHDTGRLPESLLLGTKYLQQTIEFAGKLYKSWKIILFAFSVSVIFKWIFAGTVPLISIAMLIVFFLLPRAAIKLKYCRDVLTAHWPFISEGSRQLAMLEFFICLSIAYDSTLSVHEMFVHSISSVGNFYHRKMMAVSLGPIDKRESFTAGLRSVSIIPKGMIAAINTAEISGKLENCFEDIISQLKKVVAAKLEILKYVSFAVAINCGVLIPAILILPLIIPPAYLKFALMGVLAVMGYLPVITLKAMMEEYQKKSADFNLWWKHFEDNSDEQ